LTNSKRVIGAAPWEIDATKMSAALELSGVAVLANIISAQFAAELLGHCKSQASTWNQARIGSEHIANSTIRGDRTHWLSSDNNATEAQVLSMLEEIRCALNQTLWLNLTTVEAHFAHYAQGTGYARHKDVFQRNAARVISLVLYLNPAWQQSDGGRLALYLSDGVQFVPPQSGTAVIFVSAETEHAVERTTVDRYSIAAWFRRAL